MTQVPDATLAIIAAVAVGVFGWIMFYVSETWNDEEDDDER
jgi:hypothetical protein